ncbi:hypothetical protein ACKVMT_10235 [Halobacteriales archaeon Cl-PHB]
MSEAEQPDTGGSRHTNQNNSVNTAAAGSDEIPSPAERVEEFYRKYPERANLLLTDRHGVSLRRDYCHETYGEYTTDAPGPTENAATGEQLVERESYRWIGAVAKCLEDHAETRRTTINLEKGRPSDPEYAEFTIDAETRWFSSYQKRYYAQMKAWLREICGGKRPSGGTSHGDFDDPHLALITLSASSVPDGERVGPIDHVKARRSSWNACYDTLRNTLRSRGYDLGDSWQYDRRSEPHAGERGGGLNHCYGHDHIVVAVDGPISAEAFRPVVEKHVEECDWAGPDAHDLNLDWHQEEDQVNTVTVKAASEIDNLANYVASYCGIQPVDLLERSVEYIAWAAATTAANVKTVSRSDAAKHAATADACKQRFESDHADQEVMHGEKIIHSDKRGTEVECAKCGSPHGIDQFRDPPTAASTDGPDAVADGGLVDDRRDNLRERWQDARGAAVVGESPTDHKRRERIRDYLEQNPEASIPEMLGELGLPPDAKRIAREVEAGIDPNEPVSFERGPKWQVKSVTVGEEEYPASAGTGVEIVETVSLAKRLYQESLLSVQTEVSRWRCSLDNVVPGGGPKHGLRTARYLIENGISNPNVVKDAVEADRLVNPNGDGTIPAN